MKYAAILLGMVDEIARIKYKLMKLGNFILIGFIVWFIRKLTINFIKLEKIL